jgi:hypothetical protein
MHPSVRVLLLVSLILTSSGYATVSDPNWTESVFSSDGSLHTGLAWAPDGSDRLFVMELTGRVRVLSGALTGGPATWSTFATLSPIHVSGESGLIGMAFDPNFASNHYVYFFVTVSSSEQQIIRYDASAATGTWRTVIRDQLPTVGGDHNGGGIGFAGDGKLYWSIGDLAGGVGVDADLTSLAAKVGRANRDGSLPADNPFDDGAGPNNDFIWARGMRNPFTMQIQPATGRIWLNVVGDIYEQIFLVGPGDHGGYNDFENNQPAGFITPRIAYRTNSTDSRLITSASRSGGVVTFTTSANHQFRVGGNLTISGVANTSFNQQNLYVAATPSASTFTTQQVGPDATSTGGNAETLNQGGCLTGGVFYDASLASEPYRGNFFYGDCNSGRIMRARIDPASNVVLSTDHWATGIASQVDIAVGPDAALYYIGAGTSNVYRATFNVTTQGLVVANLNLRIDEGGEAVTTVRLASAPPADVQVVVARAAGDSDVNVLVGTSLTFTPTNWSRPQLVRVGARFDPDSVDDSATIWVNSAGLTTVQIQVSVLDLVRPEAVFANGFE